MIKPKKKANQAERREGEKANNEGSSLYPAFHFEPLIIAKRTRHAKATIADSVQGADRLIGAVEVERG